MNYILSDGPYRDHLLPLTFCRPVAELRVGILTIKKKWEHYLETDVSCHTEEYLSKKFPLILENENIVISASVCPDDITVSAIKKLKAGQVLKAGDEIIAWHSGSAELLPFDNVGNYAPEFIPLETKPLIIRRPWDIFSKNGEAIAADFEILTQGRNSLSPSRSNYIFEGHGIFIEEGASIECSSLNASTGPIYLGKNSIVMEGSRIRGPFALCEESTLKMGTKIYGPTTIGPYSKVGGELNNSVIFGYTNKAHEGFLGNAVIAEWCNIGAGTNNSNLKNTYDEVRMWSYVKKSFIKTGLQFCGLIMGDHSKCGINTMFNTGTVIGVNANLYGPGFQRNYIPSFAWGGTQGMTRYKYDKAVDVATAVFKRRGMEFDEIEETILHHLYDQSE